MRSVVVLLCVIAAAGVARADASDLSIEVAGYANWPAAVAALQGDTAAEGTVLHMRVVDSNGSRLRCGGYTLVLDEVSVRAFAIGDCNADTSATDVRLVARSALFGPGDVVPQPLQAGISATHLSTGGARGGAGVSAGSSVFCSVAIQPYVTDLEHGARVYLTPGRFLLRQVDTTVSVLRNEAGWTLRRPAGGQLEIAYEVVDTRTERVVVHDTATLSCEATSLATPADAQASAPPPDEPGRPSRWAVTTDMLLLGAGYLPLAPVTFRLANRTAAGRDLGLDGSMLVGTGAVGMTIELGWLFMSVEPQLSFGEHVAVMGANTAIGPVVRIGPVVVRAAPALSLWQTRLFGFGGGEFASPTSPLQGC